MPTEKENEKGEVLETEKPEEKETEKKLTPEELKAQAEELEAELKIERQKREEAELASNYQRRIEKAQEKLRAFREPEPITRTEDVDVRDIIALSKRDIAEDSDEAQILKRYKDGGIIKSYAEGFEHAGVKAEFALLHERNTAKTVVDESDSEEYLKTTKEIIAQYRASGEVPSDPKLVKEIAKANLKDMGR